MSRAAVQNDLERSLLQTCFLLLQQHLYVPQLPSPPTPVAQLRGQIFNYSHDMADSPRYKGFLRYIEFLLGGFPFIESSLPIQLGFAVHFPLHGPGTQGPCPTALPPLPSRSHWSQWDPDAECDVLRISGRLALFGSNFSVVQWMDFDWYHYRHRMGVSSFG